MHTLKRNFLVFTNLLFVAIALTGCNSLGRVAVPSETPSPTTTPTPLPELPITGKKILSKGKYAYFRIGNRIQAIDLSDLEKPVVVREVYTQLQSNLLVLLHDKIYGFNLQWASGSKRSDKIINIIDISNPNLMKVINSYEPEKMDHPFIWGATVVNNDAYVMMQYQRPEQSSSYRNGLLRLDVSQTDHLRQRWFDTDIPLGQITAITPSTFYISALTPQNNYAIHIFHLENNGQLSKAGDLCSDCFLMAVDNDTAYVEKTTHTDTQTITIFTSYDIHNPLAPVLIRSYNPVNFYGSTVKQSRLYAIGQDGMKIYTLEKNGDILQIGFFSVRGVASDLFISNNMAYLSINNADMIVVDISNPASPKQVAHYNAFGYTFTQNPEIIADPADTQPPDCTSIEDELPVGGAPGDVTEVSVPLIATDTQNPVTYMRSSDDGVHWGDWMPYHSPHRLIIGISTNWGHVSVQMQYRDSAGNISAPCIWSRATEGW